MLHKSLRFLAPLFAAMLPACSAPAGRPIGEPVTVRITASDSSRPVRLTVDVAGGEAEFRAPPMHARATDARLTASTPVEVVLGPATTGASFRALDGGRLEVEAVAARARLVAVGARVRLAATATGLTIRDY